MSTYRTLFEIGKALIEETDFNKLLPLLMDKIIEQTKAERGMIIVHDDAKELKFETARHLGKSDIEHPEFQVSKTVIAKVQQSGKYEVIPNARADPEFDASKSVRRIGLLSVACAPLRSEGKGFGVIYIDNPHEAGRFDDATGRLLNEVGELIVGALKNALLQRTREAQTIRKLELQSELLRRLQEQLAASEGFGEIKGICSPAMLEVFNVIMKAAPTEAPVLIVGETGTGKELVARALHKHSLRREQAFVRLNCAALAENLLESELFGHLKGAFTGADKDKMGYFETADGGTIFLDEIAKSSAHFQTKLLDVLQSGEFRRVGETEATPRKADVRIIAAAGPNLRELIAQDKFYLDLFHRLKVVEIFVPPLRERHEDIAELADFFLARYAARYKKKIRALSSEIHELLLRHHWPGNVRELEHALEHAVIHLDGEIIAAQDLPRDVLQPASHTTEAREALPYAKAKESCERDYFTRLLRKTNGIVAEAARLAVMDKSNLSKKLRSLGINPKDFEK
ncbi:sigma 54-interacting transcriptional regulator [candidate division KSB1 bacterium]|nr:sigma 54-interacting transcriptional regulator [candidate division KSB1 bacterium]